MCQAEVTSSQGRPSPCPTSAAVRRAFSAVLRDWASKRTRAGSMPCCAKRRAVISASFQPRGSSRPEKPETTRGLPRSEEHTPELQSLIRNSYAVFCLKKKTQHQKETRHRV